MSKSADYRYYDGKPITLWFGEQVEPLYVQEGILARIPFFETAFRFASTIQDDTSSAPQSKGIDLSDCDRKAVADVIFYTTQDKVPPIKQLEDGRAGEPYDHTTAGIFVKAWIVADRFGLETIANALVDEFVIYHEHWVLNPSLIVILNQADHDDSRLCRFMIRDIAYQAACTTYDGWTGPNYTGDPQNESAVEDKSYAEMCAGLPQSVLVCILQSTQTERKCPTKKALKRLCQLHKHETNPKCTVTQTAESREKTARNDSTKENGSSLQNDSDSAFDSNNTSDSDSSSDYDYESD